MATTAQIREPKHSSPLCLKHTSDGVPSFRRSHVDLPSLGQTWKTDWEPGS